MTDPAVVLDAVMTSVPTGEGRFALTIPEGWQQGRGAFGGLVLGAMVRAVETTAATPERRVRTLTAQIVAPVVVGEAEIVVATWRAGAGVSFLEAKMLQAGAPVAGCVVVLGAARPGMPRRRELAPPVLQPWNEAPVVEMGPPIAPVFTQHLEYRVTGPAPYGAGPWSGCEGWVRARHRTGAIDAAHLVALADAYWPAAAARMDGVRPTATVAFSLEIVRDPASLDAAAPLYHRATCPTEGEGFALDTRELWTSAGELVAINQQTFVIIK